MAPETRWLSDGEQAAWRSFLEARLLLEGALDRQLQDDSGMPHAYFMILTVLTEADGRTMRMGELTNRLLFSPSRLSHAVDRLERRGWVARRPAPDDRRGQVARLTAAGARAQRAAAVGHVDEVRRRVFDRLTAEQVGQLAAICSTIVDGFAAEP
jgi:DNA-binding MarR family transcriptional regulator